MKRLLFSLCLLPSLGAVNAQAADVEQGHQLIETHCLRCHGSEVYTRPDRRVTTLPGLHKQVKRCEQMLGLTWFDEDINNAATYLNKEFYKFKE